MTQLFVDGNNLIHRLYHVLPPDRVLGTLIFQLETMCRDLNGQSIQVALDRDGPSFRREIFSGYKANRSAKSDELVGLLVSAAGALLRAGFEVDSVPGFEADDVIASWVHATSQNVVIVSSDKDLYQLLVGGRVAILRGYKTSRGKLTNHDWINSDQFREQYNIAPFQWPDWKALVGDKSDGMPGVAGVGESTASARLAKYGTLEAIVTAIENWGTLPATKSQISKIMSAWTSGELAKARRIHTLVRNVPFAAELETA